MNPENNIDETILFECMKFFHICTASLLDVGSNQIKENSSKCSACFINCDKDQVVILESCGHKFCNNCLIETIKSFKNVQVYCPYFDTKSDCNTLLKEHEIQRFLSTTSLNNLELRRNGSYSIKSSTNYSNVTTKVSYNINKEKYTGTKPKRNINIKVTTGPKISTNVIQYFKCSICFVQYKKQEGIQLQKCLHMFCKACIFQVIEESSESKIVCPYFDKNYCCDNILQDCDIHALVPSNIYKKYITRSKQRKRSIIVQSSCVESNEKKSYGYTYYQCNFLNNVMHHSKKHFKYQSFNIAPNPEPFNCPICFMEFQTGEGVRLHECFHDFCKDCLTGTIEHSDNVEVVCPYLNGDINCKAVLLDFEIRALLTPESYQKYLDKSIRLAENQIENTFHCKTPNCQFWCVIEDQVDVFTCLVCSKLNCIPCKAIHEGLTCNDYNIKLQNDIDTKLTEQQLTEMLARNEAMKCSKCQAIVVKIAGCDWLVCAVCKTELCWATKGPRWGPKGRNDTSGGCRCRAIGNILCAPNCGNCH